MKLHRSFLFLFIVILTTNVLLSGCVTTPNYLDADAPRYTGSYSSGVNHRYDGTLKVISWNIKYAHDIDGAIETLRTASALAEPDVLLLQEMDNDGVVAIAKDLELNYVYYPASVHPNTNRDFGEAILSPWPLVKDAKIILPHQSVRNGQIRIAARAQVQLPDASVLAYSVHTETALLSPRQRIDQVEALLDDAPDDARYVIIGGDFNTVTPFERKVLVDLMRESGLIWMTEDAGGTVRGAGIGLIMDYIFAKRQEGLESGVVDSNASDHLPVWATTRLTQ